MWSRLCSIYFVVSIILPTTAPFQVVSFGEALRFSVHVGVATPSRVSANHAVTNEVGVPSWRGPEARVRHRAKSVARCRWTSTVDHSLVATSLNRSLPGLSRQTDQRLTALRI
jgi:hypothetical protein